MKKYLAVFTAIIKEFWLDKASFLWLIAFPIVLVFGLSIVFSGKDQMLYKIGIIGEMENKNEFFSLKHVQFIHYKSLDEVLNKLRHHQIDFLISVENKNYWVNSESPQGYIVENLFLKTPANSSYIKKEITGKPIRYVDWVIPGVLGMSIMFNSLYGVGSVIVRYRRSGFLKRLKATPLKAVEYILAHISSRLLIVIILGMIVFWGCHIFLKFLILGSLLDILIIAIIGGFCHIVLGLFIASRLKNEELANGLLNIVSWPMLLLSGIWFSLEGSPKILQNIADCLPLTHFVTAVRKVMFDGSGIVDVLYPHIFFLSLFSVIFLCFGALLFKWDN